MFQYLNLSGEKKKLLENDNREKVIDWLYFIN
jgi:hypothetical protein